MKYRRCDSWKYVCNDGCKFSCEQCRDIYRDTSANSWRVFCLSDHCVRLLDTCECDANHDYSIEEWYDRWLPEVDRPCVPLMTLT